MINPGILIFLSIKTKWDYIICMWIWNLDILWIVFYSVFIVPMFISVRLMIQVNLVSVSKLRSKPQSVPEFVSLNIKVVTFVIRLITIEFNGHILVYIVLGQHLYCLLFIFWFRMNKDRELNTMSLAILHLKNCFILHEAPHIVHNFVVCCTSSWNQRSITLRLNWWHGKSKFFISYCTFFAPIFSSIRHILSHFQFLAIGHF